MQKNIVSVGLAQNCSNVRFLQEIQLPTVESPKKIIFQYFGKVTYHRSKYKNHFSKLVVFF